MHRKMPRPDDLWPYLTAEVAPVDGLIRRFPGDFGVDEVPAYAPSGEGTHLFVHFEKVGCTTHDAVRRLAAAMGVDPRSASWAGLKDRHAVTTQWASFEGATPEAALRAEVADVRVLDATPHEHKLRTGHLRGNRFHIVVREVPPARVDDVRAVFETLVRRGVPAYYEAQRFGRDGGNVERARKWLVEGGRPPRDRSKRKWDVSVLQSFVFNRVLGDRIRDGLFDRAVPGDLMRKEDTGGLFVDDAIDEAQARMDRFEISPTGPMVGPRMRWPEGEAREREEAAVAAAGLTEEVVRGFGKLGRGARRPLRMALGNPSIAETDDGLALQFALPSGGYATAVLAEIFKTGLRVHDPGAPSA